MIAVIAEYNTDNENRWVYDERAASGEELPCSIIGPFASMAEAILYVEGYQEDDTDLHDVYVVEEDFPEGTIISDPAEYPSGWKELAGGPETLLSLIQGPPLNRM